MTSTTGTTSLHPFRLPLRVPFRGVSERRGVLLHGPAGWGEFSPFPEYGPAYCSRWLRAAREAAEIGWPPAVRDRIPVNAIVPAVSPDLAERLVSQAGAATVKVKVAEPGQTLAEDVSRVAAVRSALGPAGRIRVDVNGTWDVETAVLAIGRLAQFDLEYVEQPVESLDEIAELRRRVGVTIAIDDVVRRAVDPVEVVRRAKADVVVVKVQPLGGVRSSLQVCEAFGGPCVVSSALESSVGLAAGLALAACLPELPYACGLGTGSLLQQDLVERPLLAEHGWLAVRSVNVESGLLAQAALGPGDALAELDRLAAADRAPSTYR